MSGHFCPDTAGVAKALVYCVENEETNENVIQLS